ncbi:MAG: hypothetical protein AB1813_01935 [Verrucomicrobiota bacterium]
MNRFDQVRINIIERRLERLLNGCSLASCALAEVKEKQAVKLQVEREFDRIGLAKGERGLFWGDVLPFIPNGPVGLFLHCCFKQKARSRKAGALSAPSITWVAYLRPGFVSVLFRQRIDGPLTEWRVPLQQDGRTLRRPALTIQVLKLDLPRRRANPRC